MINAKIYKKNRTLNIKKSADEKTTQKSVKRRNEMENEK